MLGPDFDDSDYPDKSPAVVVWGLGCMIVWAIIAGLVLVLV